MTEKEDIRLRELAPRDELELIIQEASASTEKDLALEDAGWINLSGTTGDVISPAERVTNLKLSRLYATKDPLGKQSIRLWTDYTFGSGMTWMAKDNKTKEVLEKFWNAPANQAVLSARGQRKSSDKVLIDGEIFFVIFLGAEGKSTIRWIDPLEITEIITNPDDKEDVRYYRRTWADTQGKSHESIYRSVTNMKDEATPDAQGESVTSTDDALIYHFPVFTITERGNPLLLPALPWMRYNTKFLASRIAITLALSKWAWKQKVKGGQVVTDAIKAKTDGKEVAAGSILQENLGVDTTPIKTETGASSAYQDGRMIKLMVYAAVGLYEQYFGDISTGNLATAKTVELPMIKMFHSYQSIWGDVYKDIDEIVLAHNQVPPDKWYVDRDFPEIAPEDYVAIAAAIQQIIQVIPEFAQSKDVQVQALLSIGVNNPSEVLDALATEATGDPIVDASRALRKIRESIAKKEK